MGRLVYSITLPCDWDRVELVRRTVAPGVQAVAGAAGLGDATAMASAELLENAIKHGGDESGTAQFDLAVSPSGEASLRVRNPSPRVTPKVDNLRQVIDWINAFEDPYQAYVERLAQVCDARDAEGGLGLVRVAYEGRGRLSYEIEPDRIVVAATFAPGSFD